MLCNFQSSQKLYGADAFLLIERLGDWGSKRWSNLLGQGHPADRCPRLSENRVGPSLRLSLLPPLYHAPSWCPTLESSFTGGINSITFPPRSLHSKAGASFPTPTPQCPLLCGPGPLGALYQCLADSGPSLFFLSRVSYEPRPEHKETLVLGKKAKCGGWKVVHLACMFWWKGRGREPLSLLFRHEADALPALQWFYILIPQPWESSQPLQASCDLSFKGCAHSISTYLGNWLIL